MPERRESSPNMGLLQPKYDADAGRLARFALGRFHATLHGLLAGIEAHTVFDAGCGEGYILNRVLMGRFARVYGADLDGERLRYARQQAGQSAIFQGNLHDIPLPAASVDLVICLEVLEHVGDPVRALDELARVTRRYALLSVPNEPFWRMGNLARGAYWGQLGNTPEHINHWSVWGFRRFVGQRFTVREVRTPVTWSFILAEKPPHA